LRRCDAPRPRTAPISAATAPRCCGTCDYLAWLAYSRTHELSERVFSAGMDVPALDAAAEVQQRLRFMTPAQQQEFRASLAAFAKYNCLSRRPESRRRGWRRTTGAACAARCGSCCTRAIRCRRGCAWRR
jgi:hypothetical protein